MKASISYDDALQNLQDDVNKVIETANKNVNPCLGKIGSVIAAEASRQAKRSNNEYYWYKGVKKANTHIADDVTYKVGKARRTKTPYVSVSGDKKTWRKWHLADEGHVAPNGRFVPGNHFVKKTEKASEEKVDIIVDEFLKGIING